MLSPSFTAFTQKFRNVKLVKAWWRHEGSPLCIVNEWIIIRWNLWRLFSIFFQNIAIIRQGLCLSASASIHEWVKEFCRFCQGAFLKVLHLFEKVLSSFWVKKYGQKEHFISNGNLSLLWGSRNSFYDFGQSFYRGRTSGYNRFVYAASSGWKPVEFIRKVQSVVLVVSGTFI